MPKYSLSGSVGNGGKNAPGDVLLVQRLLNQNLGLLIPLAPLKEDGACGPKTINAINVFQERWVHMRYPDGRVDPSGKTFLALLHAVGAEEGGAPTPAPKPQSPAPAPTPQPPPTPSGDPGQKIAWGAKVSLAFKKKVVEICARIGAKPDDLMSCMAFESGETFSPSIKNAAGSGATGLIQFMPSTARNLGTTTQDLAAMTAEQQLDYVEKYFAPYKSRGLGTIEDLYMAILWPAAVGKGMDYVLFEKGTKAYEQNQGLDRGANPDGKITKFEAACGPRSKLTKGAKFAG